MLTIRERIAAAEVKPYVSAAELALLTGFSHDTIRRAGLSGQIPTLRLGRNAVRYPREESIRAMRRLGKATQATQVTQAQRETADVSRLAAHSRRAVQ